LLKCACGYFLIFPRLVQKENGELIISHRNNCFLIAHGYSDTRGEKVERLIDERILEWD
jgi:hypothetical protein